MLVACVLQLTGIKATEMSWNLDVGAAAVGCDDG